MTYAVRSNTTVYGAWHLRQGEWLKVTEHAVDIVDMPMLRDESVAVYVSNLLKFAWVVVASRYPEI